MIPQATPPAPSPEEALDQRKNQIFSRLAALGAATAHVEYDGESDSGQIHAIAAAAADGTPIQLHVPTDASADPQYPTLHDCIEDFCWDLLVFHHAGYENNDGGFGTFTFTVSDKTIELRHSDRFVDFSTTTTEV
ncbi:MAG: DUF6878 family protein [Hyphomicrobiaceae bacterium]